MVNVVFLSGNQDKGKGAGECGNTSKMSNYSQSLCQSLSTTHQKNNYL